MESHRLFLQKGVHPEAVCAQSYDLQGRISQPGAPVSPEFDYARGIRHGSGDGPDSWNQVLDNALREPAARSETKKMAFDLRRTSVGPKRKDVARLGV